MVKQIHGETLQCSHPHCATSTPLSGLTVHPAFVSEPPCSVGTLLNSMFFHSDCCGDVRIGAAHLQHPEVVNKSSGECSAYHLLSWDSFIVSTCQAAIQTLSSHSIIRPRAPDGFIYDEANAPPGAVQSSRP